MRVYVISAVTLHREGLVDILARRDGIEVVGASCDPASVALALAGQHAVVVLDMLGFDAADVAARVTHAAGARVLAVNVPSRESDVIALAEAGVACCLTTEASLDEFVAAIGSVARGEALCSAWTAAVLQRRVAVLARERRDYAAATPEHPLHLTSRELEIVELVDQGLSNKQIASRLCIEIPTVKNHVHRILDKLGVSRRAEAAALVRSGVVPGTRGSTSPLPA